MSTFLTCVNKLIRNKKGKKIFNSCEDVLINKQKNPKIMFHANQEGKLFFWALSCWHTSTI